MDISENHKPRPLEKNSLRPESGVVGDIASAVINGGRTPSQVVLPAEGPFQSERKRLLYQILQPNTNCNTVHESAQSAYINEIELLREAELILRLSHFQSVEKLSQADLEDVLSAVRNSSDPSDMPTIVLNPSFRPYLGALIVSVYFVFTIYIAIALSFAIGDSAALTATILVFSYMGFNISWMLATILSSSVNAFRGREKRQSSQKGLTSRELTRIVERVNSMEITRN